MPRTMYDSTTVADLPAKARMVAGYVDGRYRTVDQLRKRFPKATVVTITVLGQPGAQVCDTEPGNIGVDKAAEWAKGEVAAGRRPTLYCMASQWDDVKRAVAGQGITGRVSYWVAQYDGKAQLPAGAVAKQYADQARSGGHFDVSIVADYWPGVDPPAAPSDLSRLSGVYARRLTLRLSRRRRPVRAGRGVLAALAAEIARVLALK